MRLHEHRLNLKEGVLEKSKLAQHAYKEGHRVIWDEARILEIENRSRHRKYRQSISIVCLRNLISQTSLDISPIWILLVIDEVTKCKTEISNCFNKVILREPAS
jgi:hypothetical protein